MRGFSYQPVWLLALCATPIFAAFDDFYFAAPGRNASAPRKCGNMPYGCDAPNMCSQDTLTKKYYCCEPGSSDSPCWKGRDNCMGGDAKTPSDQQTGCVYRQTAGDVYYCCDKQTELCTSRDRQFNICWSKGDNALRALNATRLNDTYSSLSSASPTATSLPVDKQQLLALTGIAPSDLPSSSTSASLPASATASTTNSSTPIGGSTDTDSSGGLSGGAIGGIVGGVVGGLALLGAIGFFLWRRRKNAGKTNTNAPPGDPYQGYGYQQPQPQQGTYHEAPYSPQPSMAQAYAPPPSDKYAHQAPVHEAPAHNPNPVEMDASYYQQQHNQTYK